MIGMKVGIFSRILVNLLSNMNSNQDSFDVTLFIVDPIIIQEYLNLRSCMKEEIFGFEVKGLAICSVWNDKPGSHTRIRTLNKINRLDR